MAKAGVDAAAIKAAWTRKKAKLDVSFILDTLNYLHKGGSRSAVAALGANILSLKPCIEVKDGQMGVGKKYRGKLDKVLIPVRDRRLRGRDDIDYSRIFITDSGVDRALYQTVYDTVAQCGPFKEILNTQAAVPSPATAAPTAWAFYITTNRAD